MLLIAIQSLVLYTVTRLTMKQLVIQFIPLVLVTYDCHILNSTYYPWYLVDLYLYLIPYRCTSSGRHSSVYSYFRLPFTFAYVALLLICHKSPFFLTAYYITRSTQTLPSRCTPFRHADASLVTHTCSLCLLRSHLNIGIINEAAVFGTDME